MKHCLFIFHDQSVPFNTFKCILLHGITIVSALMKSRLSYSFKCIVCRADSLLFSCKYTIKNRVDISGVFSHEYKKSNIEYKCKQTNK